MKAAINWNSELEPYVIFEVNSSGSVTGKTSVCIKLDAWDELVKNVEIERHVHEAKKPK